VSENIHRDGILHASIAPARIAPGVAAKAQAIAQSIAAALDYVGVLCVELFQLPDGELTVNEIAPRPHNSGHFTIDVCLTSQFEQQVRTLTGLPLGDTSLRSAAVMLNLLGDLWEQGEPDWSALLAEPDVRLHLYGKDQPRKGRKMGHVTVVGATAAAALARATAIGALLGGAPRGATQYV
jgi:5-(carboxyamino)imidazole ribonucleotide synthase